MVLRPSFQCALELLQLGEGEHLRRGSAFGRIAFARPTEQVSQPSRRSPAKLAQLQERARAADPAWVQRELVELDTPGKASVWVVILRDPDLHEVCFVGAAEFDALSRTDPQAERALLDAIAKDDSEKWYGKRDGKQ